MLFRVWLLPALQGRPFWVHSWSYHGDSSLLSPLIFGSESLGRWKVLFWGGENKAAGARCFMPVSFSSFFFQTMKFLWTLTRLWSHMDLALKELGWLLDQTLDFLHKVIGKADVDFSLLIRNKVEQSKGWCLLLHSIAQTKEGHLRIYINHTEALWDCNSFLLLCYLVSNHRSIASLADRCAILLTLAQASLAL